MKVSVIIPTLNEASTIAHTLDDLQSHHKVHEIIVADGGSSDETISLVGTRAQLVASGKGRARQMNAGAAQASGDILLFLHSDTQLPPRGIELIEHAVRQGRQAGRYRLRFDASHWLLRVYESYTRFHLFSYGDQGFFVSRTLFEQMGGFRCDVPFEDIEFYRRLRKHVKPIILRAPVLTSARRFLATGCMSQKFINIWLAGLYYLGFNITPLKDQLYPDVR